ncbi:NUDIX hydrolase, partial [Candidatus Zixiibacteriota bacterium]
MIDSIRSILSRYQPRRADPDGRIQAAVALVLVPAGEGLEMLLIKRTERDDDPWSGQMAMPGGRRDAEDDDLCQTAIRETREETAVDLGCAELIGEL